MLSTSRTHTCIPVYMHLCMTTKTCEIRLVRHIPQVAVELVDVGEILLVSVPFKPSLLLPASALLDPEQT